MPELPEVETTRKGIEPHLVGKAIKNIHVHNAKLRWPIPTNIKDLCNQKITSVNRRGKYLLIYCNRGHAIIHLGMSGSLRITEVNIEKRKHDHVEFILPKNKVLRYNDPRRFGCVLWHTDNNNEHALLARLGPEPLSDKFNTEYLGAVCINRKKTIKSLIMDSHIVVGVGNIYASESLFRSGIRPGRASGRITRKECLTLIKNIKSVLQEAIKQGGTTLKDFTNAKGKPGYFAQSLDVYGRKGKPCHRCKSIIKVKTIAQRASYYCPSCQK